MDETTIAAAIDQIVAQHGEASRRRADAGVRRVAAGWRPTDDDLATFVEFCAKRFVATDDELSLLVDRLEAALNLIEGHRIELNRQLRRWSDLRVPDLAAFDDLSATFDPSPDLAEQLERQGLAPLARLNLPRPNLEEMLREGPGWDHDDWAAARVARSFAPRIPSELTIRSRAVRHAASDFVARFHVPVGHLVDEEGASLFEPGRSLVAHWLIREQIRAAYGTANGLLRQRALAWVMARTIDGGVPNALLAGEALRWEPAANTLDHKSVADDETMGLQRYEHLLALFHAEKALDEYHEEHPTAMARANELRREIPEADVVTFLETLLNSPARESLADAVRRKLERPLEAHDIYFDDFGDGQPEVTLDELVAKHCPDAASFEAQIPAFLQRLGFDPAWATDVGGRIRVEIARGAGHAVAPGLRGGEAWLRTNARDDLLDWDAFDIAVHELGHNIEQLISRDEVPRPALAGVPNTACSEAFAFLFQGRARELLGIESSSATTAMDDMTVSAALSAWQIAGPAWLELRVWHWLYSNENATPQALRARVLKLADETWSRWYVEFFGPDPYRLMAAYQHMIAYPLYLPNYAIGHIIAHQVSSHVAHLSLHDETRRICSIGRVTPDLWLQRAVGHPLDPSSLMHAAEAAAKANVIPLAV